ncbi:DUF4268 domain-containing protein [Paludisphaera sp.]|uniref:DUF4268 domain-containing protein n=1 Tax=Paludisphaera sp. TaxID=2017432 RepID=UPI00301D6B11
MIAEEFSDWEESRRRIDLLGIDRDANLVVIELKRTEDGGHMELQAIRYAAMVSTLTFGKVVEVYADHLRRLGRDTDARASLLEFLGWEEEDEESFGQEVRVVLASAEFSKELTTAVLWLNEHGLDIRCVRMRPYLPGEGRRILVDVQQVIPLPETAAYQVRVREKEQESRRERAERHEIRRRFWHGLLAHAAAKTPLHGDISPGDAGWISTGAGMRGLTFNYVIGKGSGRVELYVDRGADEGEANKRIFDRLLNRKGEIEAVFGGDLAWQRLDSRRSCRIAYTVDVGGWRSDESRWPEVQEAMIDGMIRLERALRPHITGLRSEAV